MGGGGGGGAEWVVAAAPVARTQLKGNFLTNIYVAIGAIN